VFTARYGLDVYVYISGEVFKQLIHSTETGSSSQRLSVSFIQLSVQLDCLLDE